LLFEKTALPTGYVTVFVYVGMGASLTFIPAYVFILRRQMKNVKTAEKLKLQAS
jgi:hypothetical protein